MFSLLQNNFHKMKINWKSWILDSKQWNRVNHVFDIFTKALTQLFFLLWFSHYQWSKKYNVVSLTVYILLLIWRFCLSKKISQWWNSWLYSFITVQVWVENVVVHWIYLEKSLIADKCSNFEYIDLLSFALKINSSIFL